MAHPIRLLYCIFFAVFICTGEEIYHRAMLHYTTPDEIEEILHSPDITVLYTFDRFAKYLDVLVKPPFLEKIERAGVRCNAVCCGIGRKDYDALVSRGGYFGAYPTYSQVDSSLKHLASLYPAIFKLGTLPEKSFQGRDIYLVTISSDPNSDTKRPQALISGVVHADEPIGSIMSLHDMQYLCEKYTTDYEVQWLVNNRQIYFIPVTNPDRYVWNEKYQTISSRKRKNMRIASGVTEDAGGVDPNRNFPFRWGYDNVGSSSSPSASNYRGTAALSEPETKGIVDFVAARKIRTWQNHHNAGDYLILPYGYLGAGKYPPEISIYYKMCEEQKKFYHYAKYGNSGDCYGSWILNGGAEDWGTADSAKYGKTYKVYCIITEINPNPSSYWDYWDNKTKLMQRCDSLRGGDIYMVKCAGFYPVIKKITVVDTAPGCNKDGVLNPGENVRLVAEITNMSVVDTTPNVKGFLGTASQYITMNDSTGTYGSIKLLTDAANSADPFGFVCHANTAQGTKIPLRLRMTWDLNSVNYEKVLPCTLQVGPYTGIVTPDHASGYGISLTVFRNPAARTVEFKLVYPGSVSANTEKRAILKIYEPSGRLVRSVESLLVNRSGSIVWDGKDTSGKRVKNGMYNIAVSIGDYTVGDTFMFVD